MSEIATLLFVVISIIIAIMLARHGVIGTIAMLNQFSLFGFTCWTIRDWSFHIIEINDRSLIAAVKDEDGICMSILWSKYRKRGKR
jgi:hypothetical protein